MHNIVRWFKDKSKSLREKPIPSAQLNKSSRLLPNNEPGCILSFGRDGVRLQSSYLEVGWRNFAGPGVLVPTRACWSGAKAKHGADMSYHLEDSLSRSSKGGRTDPGESQEAKVHAWCGSGITPVNGDSVAPRPARYLKINSRDAECRMMIAIVDCNEHSLRS